ncbi:MAG: hypothetical protein KJO02_07385, partial [Erythrobacter sp.]|nr:hypothetical protein [Erythrobacter sp.]
VKGGGGNDGAISLGRDVVATWLNYLAGNNIGDAADPNSPKEHIDEAIDWLQQFASTENDASVDFAEFEYNQTHKKNSDAWKEGVPGEDLSGAEIHNGLDAYNNDGIINGVEYAGDADNAAFLSALGGLFEEPPELELAVVEQEPLESLSTISTSEEYDPFLNLLMEPVTGMDDMSAAAIY